MENFSKNIGQKVQENIKSENKEYRDGLAEDLKQLRANENFDEARDLLQKAYDNEEYKKAQEDIETIRNQEIAIENLERDFNIEFIQSKISQNNQISKQFLAKLEAVQDENIKEVFRDTKIINPIDLDRNDMIDFDIYHSLKELYAKNEKVVIPAALNENMLKKFTKDHSLFQLLLLKDTTHVVDILSSLEEEAEKITTGKQLTEDDLLRKQGHLDRQIAQERHNLNIRSMEDLYKVDESRLQSVVSNTQMYFPSLKESTNQEVIQFLFDQRENIPLVMEGQSIEGVYCDIEGTLFDNGVLKPETLDLLKKYESQGKQINLWTNGNVVELQQHLDREGINYPLNSKLDYAGASAEIVIDNDDENTFLTKTKITAKEFIHI
jgi:hypothetical protein